MDIDLVSSLCANIQSANRMFLNNMGKSWNHYEVEKLMTFSMLLVAITKKEAIVSELPLCEGTWVECRKRDNSYHFRMYDVRSDWIQFREDGRPDLEYSDESGGGFCEPGVWIKVPGRI